MSEWSDSVKIALDILIACVLIVALLACIGLGQQIMRTMDNNRAAAADVRDYRTAAAYEGTIVMPQDVVNLILTNQGFPEVRVVLKSGTTYNWTRTSIPNGSDMSSASVGSFVGMNRSFRCTLEYDIGHTQLMRYVFTEV